MEDIRECKEVIARVYGTVCPYCGGVDTGWGCDPRGRDTTCDSCGKAYTIAGNAEVITQ